MIGYVWLVLNLIFISVTLSTAKQWITKSTNFLQRNQLKMVPKMAGLLMICTDITSKMCSRKKLFFAKKRWYWAHESKSLFRHTTNTERNFVKQIQYCNIGTRWLTSYSKYAWEYGSCEFYNLEILILLSSICPIAKQEAHAHKHLLQTQNVRSHLECCVQFWALWYKGTWHWQTEVSPTKGHLDDKGLKHLSCEESLTESWFCSVCRGEA